MFFFSVFIYRTFFKQIRASVLPEINCVKVLKGSTFFPVYLEPRKKNGDGYGRELLSVVDDTGRFICKLLKAIFQKYWPNFCVALSRTLYVVVFKNLWMHECFSLFDFLGCEMVVKIYESVVYPWYAVWERLSISRVEKTRL